MTEIQPQFDLESATIESPGREVLQRLPDQLGAVLVEFVKQHAAAAAAHQHQQQL
jgi:hypothetical protein